MGTIRRKWSIQKAGLQIGGIDAYAMYIMLGAILFLYGVLGIVLIIMGGEPMRYSYSSFFYINAMAMWIGCPAYSLFKKMGKKKSQKIAQKKKGAADPMYIFSILPVEKREVKNANFYRWILGSAVTFFGIVCLVVIGTKTGVAVEHFICYEEAFVAALLLYLLCYTVYWLHMVLERSWTFGVSIGVWVVTYFLTMNLFIIDKIFSKFGDGFRLSLHIGNRMLCDGGQIFFLDPVIGNSIVVISLAWFVGLGILFFIFNRNNRSWTRRGEYE